MKQVKKGGIQVKISSSKHQKGPNDNFGGQNSSGCNNNRLTEIKVNKHSITNYNS